MACGMSRQSHHLISKQQDCLKTELAGAKVEEILQTGPQQFHHHHIVITFCSAPLYCWNAHCKNMGVNAITMIRTQQCSLRNTSWRCVLFIEDKAEGKRPLKQARREAGYSRIIRQKIKHLLMCVGFYISNVILSSLHYDCFLSCSFYSGGQGANKLFCNATKSRTNSWATISFLHIRYYGLKGQENVILTCQINFGCLIEGGYLETGKQFLHSLPKY